MVSLRMEISYRTKDESNKEKEKAFIALSGSARMVQFFALMEQMKSFPSSINIDKKNNFKIDFTLRNE